MKAVIPVAGAGTKLRPHTHTQPKALVPVAGKPLLAHIVDFLMQGGVTEFVFVIGHMGNKIQQFIEAHYQHAPIATHFVTQDPREGSGHAVLMARPHVADDESMLIMFGDTILNCNLRAFVESDSSAVGIRKVDKPGNFGIAELRKDGYVSRLIEKPRIPKSNYGLVGLYKVKTAGRLFRAIDHLVSTKTKNNGEYHLTDALMLLLNEGEKIDAIEVEGWYDCGKKDTLLEANALLLNRPEFQNSRNQRFPDTIIIHPVRIGEHCDIKRCIIGPNVVIGDHSHIENAVLSNSIIGSYSHLHSIILNRSIMGNDTYLKGVSQSLNIGDNTEINLS
jgi:glucose-1-phosphate thymidylyltransferase